MFNKPKVITKGWVDWAWPGVKRNQLKLHALHVAFDKAPTHMSHTEVFLYLPHLAWWAWRMVRIRISCRGLMVWRVVFPFHVGPLSRYSSLRLVLKPCQPGRHCTCRHNPLLGCAGWGLGVQCQLYGVPPKHNIEALDATDYDQCASMAVGSGVPAGLFV